MEGCRHKQIRDVLAINELLKGKCLAVSKQCKQLRDVFIHVTHQKYSTSMNLMDSLHEWQAQRERASESGHIFRSLCAEEQPKWDKAALLPRECEAAVQPERSTSWYGVHQSCERHERQCCRPPRSCVGLRVGCVFACNTVAFLHEIH